MPVIRVKGMRCGHCVQSVTRALEAVEGVSDVHVNLETGKALYSETKPVAPEAIRQAIRKIGFEVVDEGA